MSFATAISRHPITAHAIGEVCGQVLEAVGPSPDAALLFVTRGHAGALEDAGAVVRTVLQPGALAGCASGSVVATNEEVEDEAAVVLWAGHTGRATAAHLEAHATGPDDAVITGWPDAIEFRPSAGVLLADPFSFPTDALLASLEGDHGHLPIVGGQVAAAQGPGGNRLLVDGTVTSSGAALLLLGEGVEAEPVLSQGSRPVGQPFTVTAAEGTMLQGLGGQPPLTRIAEMAERHLTADEIAVVNRGGLHLGKVVDEQKIDFGPGDFVVHTVLGGNQADGWIALDAPVQVGDTVQFHLRDALGADNDLRAMLRGRAAESVLLFTCTGRGMRLFGEPDHDVTVVSDTLGDPPVAGMFAAGEIGLAAGQSSVHGFSASMLLLRSR